MDISEINLPKWPALFIQGQDVSIEQAKDIIFRTDGFLTNASAFSNNRLFLKDYAEKAGFDILNDLSEKDEEDYLNYHYCGLIKEKIGFIDLEYIHNTWASSSYVLGPYGFCNPDGKIYYNDNIGKYPDAEDILSDLTKIAAAFPYLVFDAAVMNDESSEDDREPVVFFHVEDGKVTYGDENPWGGRPWLEEDKPDFVAQVITHMQSPSGSEGLPASWTDEFASTVKLELNKLLLDANEGGLYQEYLDQLSVSA